MKEMKNKTFKIENHQFQESAFKVYIKKEEKKTTK